MPYKITTRTYTLNWIYFVLSFGTQIFGLPSSSFSNVSQGSYELTVIQQRLPNGPEVFIHPDHSSSTVSVQIWYRVGSKDESPGRTGLAHFFEHMMFRGLQSPEGKSFDELLETAGGVGVNAFTTRDSTAYFEEVPKESLELVLKLEAQRMTGLKLDQKSFDTEREVIENERKFRLESDAEGLMIQKAYEKAFPNHPYRWPVVGLQADLKSLTLQRALEFYQTFYHPSRATLVISGDVEPDKVLLSLNKHFEKASPPSPADEKAPRFESLPLPKLSGYEKIKLPLKAEKLLLAFRIPPLTDPDQVKLALAKEILCEARSSRLRYAMIGSGLASSLSCEVPEDRFQSLFLIFADLNPGKSHLEAKQALLDELAALEEYSISEEELSIAKTRLRFNFYSDIEENSQIAHFIGKYTTLLGDFRKQSSSLREIETTSLKSVSSVISKYFISQTPLIVAGVGL